MNESPSSFRTKLRRRSRLGKYRIVRLISTGGFAEVYEAEDTIEGIRVALRIPRPDLVDESLVAAFRKEVRLLSKLDHQNILKIKNADFIDDYFVISTSLGEGTLADAMEGRLSLSKIVVWLEQLLNAVAHVHERGIVHCDIKPENVLIFSNDRLRLTDFGIARLALRSTLASGSGTIGYLAPEQALGRPTVRSDVFSVGLLAWQMLAGEVPEWPFQFPFPGAEKVRRKIHPDFLRFLRRALEVDQKRRHRDGMRMLAEYQQLRKAGRILKTPATKKKRKQPQAKDWRALRKAQFLRGYRVALQLKHHCGRCKFPVSEAMRVCPSCGTAFKKYRGPQSTPARCSRCGRGRKLDWRFCSWCFGASFRKVSDRRYADRRYVARCSNPSCREKQLCSFARFCPQCRTKVARKWTFEGADGRCSGCGWGILRDFWEHCPWCAKRIRRKTKR